MFDLVHQMRSVIKEANWSGIEKIVAQQFQFGKQILEAGLMPILEPEVDTHSADKAQSEALLKEEILKQPPPGRCSFCVNE